TLIEHDVATVDWKDLQALANHESEAVREAIFDTANSRQIELTDAVLERGLIDDSPKIRRLASTLFTRQRLAKKGEDDVIRLMRSGDLPVQEGAVYEVDAASRRERDISMYADALLELIEHPDKGLRRGVDWALSRAGKSKTVREKLTGGRFQSALK